jgi:hypothetical protein
MNAIPEFFRIRQSFERPLVSDVAGEVQRQLAGLQLEKVVQADQTVAISAGSRGIANIAIIIKAIAEHVRSIGGQPIIIPSMGSHGGATAEGQRGILEGFGITEEYCGCPIQSSMETVIVASAAEGFDVHFDRNAFEADHVIVCGRVKPHTGFSGDIESGLMKMMLIGLGKRAGAEIYHRAIKDYSFGQIVRSVAREVLSRCNVIAGVALVENGFDETAIIEAVGPDNIEEREKELLREAKRLLPQLPFPAADLLIVDRIGKNISGTGLDTNIVGRKYLDHRAADDEYPKIRSIAIRGLTAQTKGNAIGLGLCEFCRSHVVREMDRQATFINCITGGHVSAGMTPVDFENDRDMVGAALSVIGLTEPVDAKILWISDTLHISEVECSKAYLETVQARDDLEIVVAPREIEFDGDGNWTDLPIPHGEIVER